MIDFITVSNDPSRISTLERSIGAAFPNEAQRSLTVIDGTKHDLFKGYNAGAKQTGGEVLAFVHHDVTLMANAVAFERPLELLADPTTGFIGPVGSTRLNAAGCWWGDLPQSQVLSHCRGQVGAPDPNSPFGMVCVGWPPLAAAFSRVLVVDGVLLMCHRRTFEKLGGFDDRSFSGFHFYDVEVSLRAHLAGLNNFAAPIAMFHRSTGKYDKVWEAARDAFVKKYRDQLPCAVNPPR